MDRFHRTKPIVCGPHRLFIHRLKKSNLVLNLTDGFLTDRTKPIVCRHVHRLKIHAFSESNRRMLGSIELRFFQHVVVFYVTAFWHNRFFNWWCVGTTDHQSASSVNRWKNPSVRFHRMDRSCVRGIRYHRIHTVACILWQSHKMWVTLYESQQSITGSR